MKKRILSIAAIIVIAIVAGVNYTQKSNDDLSELLLSNTDALANTEETACQNGKHCTKHEDQKCYYYTINGDGNKFITHHENQIHNGQD